MKKCQQIFLCDLDGTLADYDKKLYEDLKDLMSPDEYIKLPRSLHNESQLPKWLYNLKHFITKNPRWWESLQPIEQNFNLLDAAIEIGFDIRILTKGPSNKPSAWTEKLKWSQKYVPEAKVIVTEDKSIAYGKVLFDDYPEQALIWLKWRPRGVVLMPDYWYNKLFHHDRVFKYNKDNYEEAKILLQKIHDRKPGEVTDYDIKG